MTRATERFLSSYLRFMQRVFVISLIAPAHLTPSRWISWGRNVAAAAITSVLEFRLLNARRRAAFGGRCWLRSTEGEN